MGFKIWVVGARIIKVHRKPSVNSCNGKTNIRIILYLSSLLFNQTCLNERLLSNYTHTHNHTHAHIRTHEHTHTHTHTHTHIYIYIYIYIYIHICIFWQHFFIDTYLIEYNRHFLSAYFFVNPFELPYWSYDIRWELVDKPFIFSYFLSTTVINQMKKY